MSMEVTVKKTDSVFYFVPYMKILKNRFLTVLQYRAAAIAGFITQFFWGIFRVMIYEAFYLGSAYQIQPLNMSQVTGYIWLGQVLLTMIPWNIDKELELIIKDGTLVYEFSRPLDIYRVWFFKVLGLRTANAFLRSIPLLVLACLILPLIGMGEWRLILDYRFLQVLFGLLSLSLAFFLSAAITTIMNITMLWTISGQGITILVTTLVMLLSGLTVPLPLFPDKIYRLISFLPFKCVMDTPIQILLGSVSWQNSLRDIMLQAFWLGILVIFGKIMMKNAYKKLVVQGG